MKPLSQRLRVYDGNESYVGFIDLGFKPMGVMLTFPVGRGTLTLNWYTDMSNKPIAFVKWKERQRLVRAGWLKGMAR